MNTEPAQLDLRSVLMRKLSESKRLNPQFSLRALARTLRISPSHLSLLISGKRELTFKSALHLSERLGLSPNERNRLFQQLHTPLPKEQHLLRYELIEEDRFRLISDWYHFAILSLGELKPNRADPKWISRQLGITEVCAMEAFNRLKKLGLIEIRGKSFRQSSQPIRTTNGIPSAALRAHQKQNLQLAAEKIDAVDIDWSEFGSITMAIDPKNIPKAKEMIRKFRQEVCSELERGQASSVYTLSVQLFPLTPVPQRSIQEKK